MGGMIVEVATPSRPWVGAIALFVLVEKTMPWGDWISRLGGIRLLHTSWGWPER
jgi:predicted metal-binding membrane protein